MIKDETIVKIAKKHNKTPAQIALRWNVQRGIIVLPKSVHKERIHENINIFDFKLDDEDMKEINQLGKTKKQRVVMPVEIHGFSPFDI